MPKKTKNTKTKIVEAAWDLFYSQGYDDTTIDDIVDKSQTSKGSFYHYFESKDALLGSLAYLFDNKYEELKDTISSDMNAFDVLIYLNRELFELIDNKIDPSLIAKLYSTQLIRKGEKSLLDHDRLYYRLLKQIVINGQKKKELTDSMSVNEIVNLYAMCERALISEWCMRDWAFSLKTFSEINLPKMISCIKA